jgi:hypothetical protein
MSKCQKQRYPFEAQALAAGQRTARDQLQVTRIRAYQCDSCRYPSGKRAWHWGHQYRRYVLGRPKRKKY